MATYSEVLNVGEDLIVQSEVIAGDDIDTSVLLDVPVLKTESLGLGEEISLGELSAPVSFGGLLQVTVDAHAGETEDGAARAVNIVLSHRPGQTTSIGQRGYTYD